MSAPPRIAALALAAALAAAPATALAQNGAGDEQYSDPFSGQPAPSRPKAQAGPARATPAPHQQVQSAPQPAAPGAASAAPPAATGAGLPRTGADVLPLALLGAALIGAGALLLRRRGAHARD